MKPPAILKNLPFRLPARFSGSPAVTPLPIRSAFDQNVSAELDPLVQPSATISSTSWLLDALDAAISIHNIAHESFQKAVKNATNLDRNAIDHYLDNNTELLDVCNELLERIEAVQKYTESLKIVTHLLERRGKHDMEPNVAILSRAQNVLHSSESMEMQSRRMNNFRFGLDRKLSHKKSITIDSEMKEILTGSTCIVSIVCSVLGIALSFKTKHSSSIPQRVWSKLLVNKVMGDQKEDSKISDVKGLSQLQRTVEAAHALRYKIKCQKANSNELWIRVEELKRSWEELEEGTKAYEVKVKELSKNLMSFRMVMLDILSKT